MSLFDDLVDQALKNQRSLAPLRMVVEKELLHHDILRVLSGAGLLAQLTFIGGTCLRACYGSNRLSQDLDFTGGTGFNRNVLAAMAEELIASLKVKYGLNVEVSEPVRDTGNTDTWKLKLHIRPSRKDLPAQRINIDVCAIPSYQARPMLLRNPYGVEMGTSGLIVQAESREEIFASKIVAFALRPNSIKHRDLWDLAWLRQQGVTPALELLRPKLKDHHSPVRQFLAVLDGRRKSLKEDPEVATGFRQEMQRFLAPDLAAQTVEQAAFWTYLANLMDELCAQAARQLRGAGAGPAFRM